MPASVWTALARLDPIPEGHTTLRWVPLVLAPFWVESHHEPPTTDQGIKLIQRLIQYVAGGPPKPNASENPPQEESPYDSWNWPDE